MTLSLAGLLLAWAQESLGPVERELLALARHQGEDGLWGRRPSECVCLVDPVWPEAAGEGDPALTIRVKELIDRLSDDAIGAREAAERELFRIGRPAVSQLRRAATGADGESAARCRGILDRLGRGLEAADPGLTGLAVLSFLGAGYSHLSKDTYDGICFGTAVRRGLDALKTRQAEDGSYDPKDPVSNAWAALAMVEAYGLTGSDRWKQSAEIGLASVERAGSKDARQALWWIVVARAGSFAAIRKDLADAMRAVRGRLAEMEGMLSEIGDVVLDWWIDRRRGGPRAEALVSIDPDSLDGEGRFLLLLGVRTGLKFGGQPQRAWRERLRERLVQFPPSVCGLPQLRAGLRECAFRVLTLEACSGYRSSLADSGLTPFER
jgi:hypothetical protein